jgi:hypothetical protein
MRATLHLMVLAILCLVCAGVATPMYTVTDMYKLREMQDKLRKEKAEKIKPPPPPPSPPERPPPERPPPKNEKPQPPVVPVDATGSTIVW